VSQGEEQGKSEPPVGGARKLKVPLAFLLATLAVLGGYYFLHYKQNVESLAARNLRILATLGHQVRKVVEGEGRVLDALDRIQPLDNRTMKQTLEQAPKLLGLQVYKLRAEGPDHERCPPGEGKISLALEPAPEGEGQLLEFQFECLDRKLHAWRPLDELLEPLFLPRLASEAFDPSRRRRDMEAAWCDTGLIETTRPEQVKGTLRRKVAIVSPVFVLSAVVKPGLPPWTGT